MENKNPSTRGRLIVIEGIDGTGKSTLAAALADALAARGRPVRRSAEPTGGEHGRRIRELARSGREAVTPAEELELFIADRREHVAAVIEPTLAAGTDLILDRYYYSTIAYQGARGADPAAIAARHAGWAPLPDLLVILELPVAEALRRITGSRGSAPDHFEGAEYLARVAAIFAQLSHPNLLRLDARQPVAALVDALIRRLDAPPQL